MTFKENLKRTKVPKPLSVKSPLYLRCEAILIMMPDTLFEIACQTSSSAMFETGEITALRSV